jgi:hypothetical protein
MNDDITDQDDEMSLMELDAFLIKLFSNKIPPIITDPDQQGSNDLMSNRYKPI